MPARRTSDWIKSFVQFASYGEAPIKMYFWVAVATIAGALRRRVWIDQKYFQWVPNCYIILVAPPGIISKSTTANIGMSMLKEVPGITMGPDVVTWQKLVEDMAKSKELIYWPEKEAYLPMSCLTIASSEFGTLLNPADREMVDVLVSLWDGQPGAFSKSTKTSGSDQIENPWINIIACTTPSWIAGNFPEYMIGGGFTSRCIWVYGDKKRQTIAYPADHVPAEFKSQRDDLLHDLEIISTLVGEYTLSPAATSFGEQWYDEHWKKPHDHLPPDQFGGYLARKQTHIHKLAMILTASQSDELIIEQPTLELAAGMVDVLEESMPKVFDRIGRTTQTKVLGDLVDIVITCGRLSRKELFRRLSRFVTWQEFSNVLQSALEGGFVRQIQEGSDFIIVLGKGQ